MTAPHRNEKQRTNRIIDYYQNVPANSYQLYLIGVKTVELVPPMHCS